MPKRMIIHDERVTGKIRDKAFPVYGVSKSESVKQVFSQVAVFARQQNGLDELIILAHGSFDMQLNSSPGNEIPGTSSSFVASGPVGVVVLGKEKLTSVNVSHAKVLNGLVSSIYLLSCSIAEAPEKRLQNTIWDGRLLCRNLAGHANAEVFASSSMQEYSHQGPEVPFFFGIILWAPTINVETVLNMEPPVYRYPPDGTEATIVKA